jgi:hypothetical protein
MDYARNLEDMKHILFILLLSGCSGAGYYDTIGGEDNVVPAPRYCYEKFIVKNPYRCFPTMAECVELSQGCTLDDGCRPCALEVKTNE